MEFGQVFGFVFGGVPLRDNPYSSLKQMSVDPNSAWEEIPALFVGWEGWDLKYTDLHTEDFNPSHHYAGLFVTGFFIGWWGHGANYARVGHISQYNAEDIRLGYHAVNHGTAESNYWLSGGLFGFSFHQLGDVIRQFQRPLWYDVQ